MEVAHSIHYPMSMRDPSVIENTVMNTTFHGEREPMLSHAQYHIAFFLTH